MDLNNKYYLTRSQRVRSLLSPNTPQATLFPLKKFKPLDLTLTKNQSMRQTLQLENTSPGFKLRNYEFVSLLGKGQYGKVYKAYRRNDSFDVAIKVYEKCLLNPTRRNNINREITILRSLDHPNIIKLLDVIENQRSICLVLQFGGELSLRKAKLSEKQTRIVAKQLLNAVQYMNSRNVIHRDLKLENILYHEGQIKIIDFGFAILSDGSQQRVFCGTPNYMAPELLQRQVQYSYEVDVWACGVILYYLLTQQFPFKGETEPDLYMNIRLGKKENVGNNVAQSLLQKLLSSNPRKRMTASDALADPWLQEAL